VPPVRDAGRGTHAASPAPTGAGRTGEAVSGLAVTRRTVEPLRVVPDDPREAYYRALCRVAAYRKAKYGPRWWLRRAA